MGWSGCRLRCIEQRVTVIVGVCVVTNPVRVGVNRLCGVYRKCIEIIVHTIRIRVSQ